MGAPAGGFVYLSRADYLAVGLPPNPLYWSPAHAAGPTRRGVAETQGAAPEPTPQVLAQPPSFQFVHSAGIPGQPALVPQPQHTPSFFAFGAIFVKRVSETRSHGLIEPSLTEDSRCFFLKADWVICSAAPAGNGS